MPVESINYEQILAKEFSSLILKGHLDNEFLSKAVEFLFIATMQGHQCVTVEDSISPKPSEVFLEEFYDEQQIKQGFYLLKDFLVTLSSEVNLMPIVHQGHDFYLQKNFVTQQALIRHLAAFVKAPLHLKFSEVAIIDALSSYRGYLNKEQYEAVLSGLNNNLQILSGGPGTGKSYTVFYLLKTFLDLCYSQNIRPKILVIAPTGKAASVLNDRLSSLKEHAVIEVATVHKALKTAFRKDSKYQELFGYDFIVLDEASMVDIGVYEILCRCLPEGIRVVFMGDHHQLPPVESSMVFEYLMDCLPHSILKISKRVENQALLELSEKIKLQELDYFEKFFSSNFEKEDITYIECPFEEPFEKLLEKALSTSWLQGTFLTPIKHGPWGVEILNYQMLAISKEYDLKKIPILVTKNQYELDVFNGDIGYLLNPQEPVVTFFSSNGEKQIPLCLIHQWTSAFALTIHKSQGSEYDHVVLFLPKGAERFGKELLYTAVTRAKKKVTIFAVEGVLLACLKKNGSKHSKISHHLSELLS